MRKLLCILMTAALPLFAPLWSYAQKSVDAYRIHLNKVEFTPAEGVHALHKLGHRHSLVQFYDIPDLERLLELTLGKGGVDRGED